MSVTGTLTESPNPERQRFELQSVTQVTPVNTLTIPFTPPNTQPTTTHSQKKGKLKKGMEVDVEVEEEQMCLQHYPFSPRKSYSEDFTRAYPMFRAKTGEFASVMRVRSALSFAIHSYFQRQGFVHIHTPALTSNDCEGAGEVFTVIKKGESDYFDGQDVYLSVSGQLHLEAMTNGLARTYTFGPAFRAERSRTRRHLCEFQMVEAEVAFQDKISDVTDLTQDLIKSTVTSLLEGSAVEDLENYRRLSRNNKLSRSAKDSQKDSLLSRIADQSRDFITMTFDEAVAALEKSGVAVDATTRSGKLSKEQETFLVERYCDNVPVFVVDWPQASKPFYCRLDTDTGRAQAVDLLFPTVGELVGGSLREHRFDVLEAACKRQLGEQDKGMDWYLAMRKAGSSPTGGFGMGFERLVQFVMGCWNIRDTIPFSRTPHSCKL